MQQTATVQNVSSVGLRKKIYYKDWNTGPIVTFSHGLAPQCRCMDGQMQRAQGALPAPPRVHYHTVGHNLRGEVGCHRRWLTPYACYVLGVSGTRDRANAASGDRRIRCPVMVHGDAQAGYRLTAPGHHAAAEEIQRCRAV